MTVDNPAAGPVQERVVSLPDQYHFPHQAQRQLVHGEALCGAVAGLEGARVTLAKVLQRIREGQGT
jgi:hypothetical protein